MLYRNTLLLILSFFVVSQANAQQTNEDFTPGTYGAYADVSTYIELVLNDDGTFSYHDQFELGSPYKFTGTWKRKGHKIHLYNSKNDSNNFMPTQWKIKKNQLWSGKVISRAGAKRRLVLTFKQK